METSLADPTYRRQHRNRADVKRLDGVWYGTYGIEEDPWNIESAFQTIKDHLSNRARNSMPSAMPPRENTTEEFETENICCPEEFGKRRFKTIDGSESDIHHSLDMENNTSQAAVQDLMGKKYHQQQQHEPQEKANNSQSHSRLRAAGLLYLKVMETRQNSQRAAHPTAERELNWCVKNTEDHAALLHEYWQAPESPLDFRKAAPSLFLPNSDEKLRRPSFLALANTLPPLPLQTSEELTALESVDDCGSAPEPISRISPNANTIEPAVRHPGENPFELLRLQDLAQSERGSELPTLPPLPLQDEEELQSLDPHDIFCRRKASSCEILHTSWINRGLGQSHELQFEFLPREVSLKKFQGETQNMININPFTPPAEVRVLPDTIYEAEYSMNGVHTLSRYPPRPPSPEERPIDPFSPLGKVAIQKIRDYFHIPANIGHSRFTDYFNERARISEGMVEDRILASPTFGLDYEAPKLSKKNKWNFFILKSREDDVQRRDEIVELCSRLQWPEFDESPEVPEEEKASSEDETSEWEASDYDEDDNDDSDESSSDEELDRWRDAETKKLIESVFDHLHASPHSQFSFASESAGTSTTDLPPRPVTPSPYSERFAEFRYEGSEEDWNSTEHSFPDKEAEPEIDSELLVVSAPVCEDPKSPHKVKNNSPLRMELVFIDGGEWHIDEQMGQSAREL